MFYWGFKGDNKPYSPPWSLNQLKNRIGSEMLHVKLDLRMRCGPLGEKETSHFSHSLDFGTSTQGVHEKTR